jgi:hypothetical protein
VLHLRLNSLASTSVVTSAAASSSPSNALIKESVDRIFGRDGTFAGAAGRPGRFETGVCFMSEPFDDDLLNDERVTVIPPGANSTHRNEEAQGRPAGSSDGATFCQAVYAEFESRVTVILETEDAATGRRTRYELARNCILRCAMRIHAWHHPCNPQV